MASDAGGFSDTIQGFGYEFKEGKLSNIKTGEGFQFVVREGDQSYNQKHYEALGEVITEEVYKLLESECGLKRSPVPKDADKNLGSFIFVSDDALTNPDKLLVLIHGSGVVRAGQWARRLIINDCLDSGTQIPFIKEAQKEGYGILVMNTNDNSRKVKGVKKTIKGSSDPEQHAAYVWKKYVRKAKAEHIAVIAHSYGGCVTTFLFQNEKEDFKKRVFAVAMTDSVHYISRPEAFKDLCKMSCNWVSSTQPLDTTLQRSRGDIKRVSAGVNVHEQTSWSSFTSVFKFLKKRYDAVTKGEEPAEDDEGKENKEEGKKDDCEDESLPRSMSIVEGKEEDSQTLSKSMSIGDVSGKEEDAPDAGADVPMEEVKGAHTMSDSEDQEDGDAKTDK